MAIIKKNQGPVMVLSYNSNHNDFPFLEGSGEIDEFDIVNIEESVSQGKRKNISIYCKASESQSELLINLNPIDITNPFLKEEEYIRIPIPASKSIVFELKEIPISKLAIVFNGELTEGSSNIEELIITVN